ncbi:MAG: TetR/AcrR family transcriptional regulator [Succinivibrionaceae bacterium]|nr:TetR/AcrR family transcriptional regulator [Succinivibrionaceae bacterium]
MAFKRARTEEQVAERRERIVEIALSIYDRDGYSAVTFSAISRRAGLTRPALYGYFRNPNDILVHALGRDFGEIDRYLRERVAGLVSLDTAGLALIIHDALMAHPRMLKMLSLNYSVLENGCTEAALTAYKGQVLGAIATFNQILDRFFPHSAGTGRVDLEFVLFTFITSVYILTHPSDKQLRAIHANDPSFAFPGFEHLCEVGLRTILASLGAPGGGAGL